MLGSAGSGVGGGRPSARAAGAPRRRPSDLCAPASALGRHRRTPASPWTRRASYEGCSAVCSPTLCGACTLRSAANGCAFVTMSTSPSTPVSCVCKRQRPRLLLLLVSYSASSACRRESRVSCQCIFRLPRPSRDNLRSHLGRRGNARATPLILGAVPGITSPLLPAPRGGREQYNAPPRPASTRDKSHNTKTPRRHPPPESQHARRRVLRRLEGRHRRPRERELALGFWGGRSVFHGRRRPFTC